MGLQVWLPLNGSLENRGLSNLRFSAVSTNTTTNAAGKTGTCYSNNSATAGGLVSDTTINLGTVQSMFCWVKFTSLTSASSLGLGACGQHRHPNCTGMGITMKYVSSTTGYLSVNTGTGSARTYNTYCGSTLLSANTWYHIGFTYDGSNIKLYVNGVLDGTHAFTGMKCVADYVQVFGWSFNDASTTQTLHGNYKTIGSINDVRIYDHCLSPKEIKEISKALCLHYTLNNNGCGQENLVKGNYSVIATATSKTSTGSATITLPTGYTSWNQLIGKTVTLSYEYAIEGARLNNTGTYSKDRFGIHGTVTGTNSAGSAVTHYPFASYLEASGRGKAVQTFTFPTSMATVTGFTLALQAYNQPAANSPDTWYIKNVKLELGDKATAFVLHKEDAGYSAMGVDKEYDTSGYRNNATPIDSTITYLYSSPRYDVYAKFDGNTSGLKIENTAQISPVLNNGIFTISFWVKHDVASNREIYFGNYDATADFNLERTAGNDLRFYWNASPDLTMSGTTISDANWHHIVVTRNGSAVKCYIDGVSKYSGTATIASLTFDGSFRLGRDTRTGTTAFGGGMSDFRLYATALSEADIKELYNAPAAVDNDGNMYAMQLVEVI